MGLMVARYFGYCTDCGIVRILCLTCCGAGGGGPILFLRRNGQVSHPAAEINPNDTPVSPAMVYQYHVPPFFSR